ncbi:helix-turn-helix domain-containing protein [Salinicoccus sp. CNSTN-B1]
MNRDRLIHLREKKGWTKAESARRLSIATSTYSSYEYGHRKPDSEMLVKIAKLHDVSTDYLLGNDREEKANSLQEADVLMFSNKEGFDNLSEADKQELRELLNDQLEFWIEKKNKGK